MKKSRMVRLTALLLSLLIAVNASSALALTDNFTSASKQLSKNQVIDKIMQYSSAKRDDFVIFDFLEMYDGSTLTEKSQNPKKESMSISTFPDGSAIYEIFDVATELSYKILIPDSTPSRSAFGNAEMTVTDIGKLRKENTVTLSMTDDEETQVRILMDNSESLDELQSALTKSGFDNLVASEISGSFLVEFKQPTITRGYKYVNPTKQDINSYAPILSYALQGSQSQYNTPLGRTINTRVYMFRNNFAQSSKTFIYVDSATLLIDVARLVITVSGITLTSILGWAGVIYSANALGEAIQFQSEISYTYTGEKSGWAYDYVTPNAAGRYLGYVKVYNNSNSGKITMGWDTNSSGRRSNYRWTNTVHPAAYDKVNSTILAGAYNVFTSNMILYGYWPG